ncbi:phosphatases II [Durotheca rogersii]|uniref:phosphatases II n=1 Tax=Durotheca rogersii TaxID=419775 RepID=UPI002220182B|nr:phosphatases II [Durotheca rogersii]KAI5863669.1 phosphatases II [Durotheca rogersii]
MDHIPGRFWRSRKVPSTPSSPATRAGSPPDKSSAERKINTVAQRQSAPSLAIPDSQPARNGSMGQIPKSPFRAFHFRSSHKRARSPPPASLPVSASPVVVNPDITIDTNVSPPTKDKEDGGAAVVQEKPMIPAFLAMSRPEIESKFHELAWQERFRISESFQNPSPSYRFARVTAPEAKFLDRYANIQPWENNRVKLQVPEGQFDYINASPITLYSPINPEGRPPHRYIAMQGPKEQTMDHVWRMVVEQLRSPAVIVMLTQTHEGHMEKCFPYYPDLKEEPLVVGEDDEFGDGFRAEIRCVGIEQHAKGAIEMRKLNVHVDGRDEDMTVWHLLYRKWPDFGIPDMKDISSFFELMRLSREKNASEDNPRIVHCSAGVGRSGTFIALEHLMREVETGDLDRRSEKEREEDIVFQTVDALREQRKQMVQAETQYVFIYQVLRKLWLDKHGLSEEDVDEPAAKRLEVDHDPFVDHLVEE